MVGLEVHLLLVGHEVCDGERVVEIVVGVHGLEGVVVEVQVMHASPSRQEVRTAP